MIVHELRRGVAKLVAAIRRLTDKNENQIYCKKTFSEERKDK